MILLDTHVWIWWTVDVDQLTENLIRTISESEGNEIGVSAISCWEIAKLVERGQVEAANRFGEMVRGFTAVSQHHPSRPDA